MIYVPDGTGARWPDGTGAGGQDDIQRAVVQGHRLRWECQLERPVGPHCLKARAYGSARIRVRRGRAGEERRLLTDEELIETAADAADAAVRAACAARGGTAKLGAHESRNGDRGAAYRLVVVRDVRHTGIY